MDHNKLTNDDSTGNEVIVTVRWDRLNEYWRWEVIAEGYATGDYAGTPESARTDARTLAPEAPHTWNGWQYADHGGAETYTWIGERDAEPRTQAIVVESRANYGDGIRYYRRARLLVRIVDPKVRSIPDHITTQDQQQHGWVDGCPGYTAYAAGVRYADLPTFLRGWHAVAVRAL